MLGVGLWWCLYGEGWWEGLSDRVVVGVWFVALMELLFCQVSAQSTFVQLSSQIDANSPRNFQPIQLFLSHYYPPPSIIIADLQTGPG